MVLDRYRAAADRLLLPAAMRLRGVSPNAVSWAAFLAAVGAGAAFALGGVVTAAMAFSPLLSGLLQVRGDELVFLVLRFGLPIYGGGTFIFFLGILVGIGVRERFG